MIRCMRRFGPMHGPRPRSAAAARQWRVPIAWALPSHSARCRAANARTRGARAARWTSASMWSLAPQPEDQHHRRFHGRHAEIAPGWSLDPTACGPHHSPSADLQCRSMDGPTAPSTRDCDPPLDEPARCARRLLRSSVLRLRDGATDASDPAAGLLPAGREAIVGRTVLRICQFDLQSGRVGQAVPLRRFRAECGDESRVGG